MVIGRKNHSQSVIITGFLCVLLILVLLLMSANSISVGNGANMSHKPESTPCQPERQRHKTGKGLTQEHHSQLNRHGVEKHEYDRLRQLYKDDPLALEQIDIYDGKTVYHEKIAEYVHAMKSSDRTAIARLDLWFAEHYPLTSAR